MATVTLFTGNAPHGLVQYITSRYVSHMLRCYVKVDNFPKEYQISNRMKRLRESHFDLISLGYSAFVLHRNHLAHEPYEVDTGDFIFNDYHQFLCETITNKNALEVLRKYIRTAFVAYFDEIIEFNSTSYLLEDEDIDMQGTKEMLASIANWVSATCTKAIDWTVEKIVDSFKMHFNGVVEKYCPIGVQVCGWISNVWDKVTAWIAEVIESVSWFLKGTKELIVWGVCILASSCAIGVLEKALVGLGFLSGGMDLVKTFLTGSVLTGSFMCLKGFKSEEQVTFATMVSLMAGVVSTVITAAFGCPTIVVAQSGPTELLEMAATSLNNFCNTTLVSMGKTCQAINQISTCATNLKSLAGKIFSCLQNFVWQMFGMESRFLRDASLMFEEDLDKWLKDIAKAQDTFLAKAYATQDDMMQMQVLIKKGQNMRQKVLSTSTKLSPVLSSTIVKGVDAIEKLLRDATIQGVKAVRKLPFVVYAHGKSRVGKTLVVNKLISDFQQHFNLPSDTVYSRNPVDSYWSGYRRQPIILIDDFGAVECDPSMEAQLIPLVSSAPYPLTMASVEEKGLLFDSKFIFCSSNRLEPSPESKVHDDEAFRNRRHVLIDVTLNPNVPYDASDVTKNQIYTILKYDCNQYIRVAEFHSYGDLLAYCLTAWEGHDMEQTQNLESDYQEPKLDTDFDKFEHLLNMAVTYNTPLKELQALMKMREEQEAQFVHFVSFRRDNKLWHYALNGKMQICEWKQEVTPEEEKVLEAKSERLLLQSYKVLRYSENTNLVIKTHLDVLAREDSYDEKMNFIGVVGNPNYHAQIKPIIDKMPSWQRLIMCGMGAMLSRKKESTWYSTVIEGMKDVMYTMYSKEIEDWPIGLKVVSGVVLASIAGAGFWKLFDVLKNAGNGGAFAGAAAVEFAVGQSRKPNRYDVAQYKYRNVPLTRRAWAQGTMPIEHATAAIMTKIKASLQYGRTEVQIVILPGRRFLGYSHFFKKLTGNLMVQIHTANKSYWHTFKASNMEYFENSELCLYTDGSLEDIPSSCWDLFCWDFESKQMDSFPAEFLSCKPALGTGAPEPQWAPIDVKLRTKCLEIRDGDYIRRVPMYLEYAAPTVNFDCGSLVVAKVGTTYQVVGIHVAGHNNTLGFASLLPPVAPVVQAQCAQKYFNFYAQEEEVRDGIAMIGELKEGVWIPLPTKTALQETPELWHLDTPCDKYPSILSNDDERLKISGCTDYDPFSSGVLKYAEPMGVLNQELLTEVADEIVEIWFDCVENDESFEEVSMAEALNGIEGVSYMERIPLATSEGFPHILSRKNGEKGKGRFVEGDGIEMYLIPDTSVTRALDELEADLENHVPTLVGIECPKDEKLPYRKVFQKPKTRCFTILPMEYNLLVRRKFLRFVRFIMRRRDKLACQVGINPYSMEWSELAGRLLEKGNNVLCCDYSSFDGLLSKQVMRSIANMINRLCGGSTRLQRERENLLLACCSRLAICKKQIWKVECGIPSGFPLTVICNSIFNEILIRYSYKAILREQKVPKMISLSFDDYVTLVTYGDDNLISVHGAVKPYFDGTKLKHFLAKLNITITDGKDKTSEHLLFRKLEECDFLKRGFLQRSTILWDAPEEKASLWAQLHYVNTNNLELHEAYKVNLVSVLRELYMWDPKESASFRRKALRTVSWLDKSDVPTMEQIGEFYAIQRQQKLPDSADSMDLLTQKENLGPILAPKGKQHGFEFSDQVRTVNLSEHGYEEAAENEVWFICNTMYPQNRLPCNVIPINWQQGVGRGGLPTQHWMEANVFRKNCNIRKLFESSLKEEKKVVVASRDAILPCNVLALLLMAQAGIIRREVSNAALTKIIEQVKTLGFLPKEVPMAF